MSARTPGCEYCGRDIPARVSKPSDLFPNGVPQGSNYLRLHDPREFFCTLRCGFMYGVLAASNRYPEIPEESPL